MSANINWKWFAVTLVFGLLAFLASPNAPLGHIWGHEAPNMNPTGLQKVLFILLSIIQSFAFGLGIAFLIFGQPYINAILHGNKNLSIATYLAMAWSLMSWWPHTNFHQTLEAGNLSGLLAIEYGFHVTLIFGALIIVVFFLTFIQQKQK